MSFEVSMRWVWLSAFSMAVALSLAHPALAVQHLVKPGEDWQRLESRLRAGDEIVLMPGRHRAASFEKLIGRPKYPIVIRGADPNDPPLIEGKIEGIRIKMAAHVVIRNVKITGGTICGISVKNGTLLQQQEAQRNAGKQLIAKDILIENVEITKVGPRGLRHAIVAAGIESMRIVDCQVVGWGGSAVELVGCKEVTIQRCTFRGLTDHSQQWGVRTRGGTERVQIEFCTFENVSERLVSIGAASLPDEFVPALSSDPKAVPFEAANVRVEHCTFIGGLCPIAFINADDCVVRNNTFVRPKHTLLALITEQEDPRFTTGKRNIFGMNIVVWEPGDLRQFANVHPKVSTDLFVLEENIWWSTQTADERKRLGSFPGKQQSPQTTDVDPKLNETHRPTESSLRMFGAK